MGAIHSKLGEFTTNIRDSHPESSKWGLIHHIHCHESTYYRILPIIGAPINRGAPHSLGAIL